MSNQFKTSITPEHFGTAFKQGKTEQIYKQCIKDFQDIITFEQFHELVQTFNQQVDSYHLLETTSLGELMQYVWIDQHKEKAICVAFDHANAIHLLIFKPYMTFPTSDEQYSKNTYTMPISEQWFVFWGGTNEFINYHYVYESQRYAYDLVVMLDGKTYKDNTIRNENYYAYGKEVIVPAGGKVVKVVNHLRDNIPGEMEESQPAGNYVVLQHANQEYSLLAHFKQHSIMVKEGDSVKQGDLIGYCGNSGNSSEPHIHFQVMDSPDYMNCRSIRIRFNNGMKPIQGDFVKQSFVEEKMKMDTFDKVEATFTLADFLLIIPRFISTLFK